MTMPSVINSANNGGASSSATTTTATITLASASNGKLIVLTSINNTDTTSSVSDSVNGALTQLGSTVVETESSSVVSLSAWGLNNPSSGAHTITATRPLGTTGRWYMVVIHVQDAKQATPLVSAGTTSSTDLTSYSDSLTTTSNDTLVIAVCATGGASVGSTTTISYGASQTNVQQINPGSTQPTLAASSLPAATPGSQTSTFTYDVTQRRAALISLGIEAVAAAGGGGTNSGAFFAFIGDFC